MDLLYLPWIAYIWTATWEGNTVDLVFKLLWSLSHHLNLYTILYTRKPAFRKGTSIILSSYIVVKLHQATFYSILSNIAFFFFFLCFGCTGSLIRCGGFSCSGTWAQLLCRMWVLVPQPGIEPTYPTLESRFLTTGTPGKYQVFFFFF